MTPYLVAILLSVGAGALYASLAEGLLLTYRGSGVINFSHGAIAMYGAYFFAQLRQTGQLLIPPIPNPFVIVQVIYRIFGGRITGPRIPTLLSLGGPQGTLVSLLITLVAGALSGLLLYLVVFRPLRHAPPLAGVVASAGIMLTLQAVVVLRFGSQPESVPAILTSRTITLFGQRIPENRLILAGIAILLTVGLAAVYRYTKFGWATEAAAESEKGALLTGLSPNRLAALNWILGSLIAVLIGVLFSTITALSPSNFVLFVLPALAALLLSGMRSFMGAAVASFAVAACQQVVGGPLIAHFHWLPQTGLSDGLVVILIIIAMVIRGKDLPTRDDLVSARLPAALVPSGAWRAWGLAVLGIVGAIWLPFDYRSALINSAVGIVIAISLVVLVGLLGQISLMQMALAGATAVVVSRLVADWGIPFPIAPILGALAAMIAGLIAAIPALRIRGTNLAIVTLAAAFAFESMVLNDNSFVSGSQQNIPLHVLGLKLGINDSFFVHGRGVPNPGFVILTVVVAAAACYVFVNLRTSSIGRQFLAVRSNERAAAAVGVNVRGVKILGFAIAAFLAGVAGSLTTYQFQGISSANFATLTSLVALATVYLGGIATLSGGIVAGVIVGGGLMFELTNNLFHVPKYQVLISSVGLVIAVVQQPEGISGEFRKLRGVSAAAGRWREGRNSSGLGESVVISPKGPVPLVRHGE